MAAVILTNPGTADLLEVVTSAAVAVDSFVSYLDNNAGAISGGREPHAISTATTTTILAGPGSGVLRTPKYISLRNKDAALSTDVTVRFNVNGTSYELFKATLAHGDELIYNEDTGWFQYVSTAKLDAKLRVASDVVFATAATFADITGLTCPVTAGKQYCFEAHLYHISNATTTGAQFAIGGVAMTAMRISEIDTILASLTAAGMGTPTGDVAAINTAAMAEGTGAATVVPAILSGWFNPSASGTFAIRATSEVTVAAGLTVKQGSWARVWEADN